MSAEFRGEVDPMQCSKCSANVTQGVRFCPSCGTPAQPSAPLATKAPKRISAWGLLILIGVVAVIVSVVRSEKHLSAARSAVSRGDWATALREARAVRDSSEARTIVERAEAEIALSQAQEHVQQGRWAEAHGALSADTIRVLTQHHSDLAGIVANITTKYLEQLKAQAAAARQRGDLEGLLLLLASAQALRVDRAVATEINGVRLQLAEGAVGAGELERALEQLAHVPDDFAGAATLRERASRELIGPLLARVRQAIRSGAAADAVAAITSVNEVAGRHPTIADPHGAEIAELSSLVAWLARLAREEDIQPMTTDIAALAVGLAENNPVQAFAEFRRREMTPLQRGNFLKSDEGAQALRRIEELKPQVFAPERLYALTIEQRFPRYDTNGNCFVIGLETLDGAVTTQTDENLFGNVYFVGVPVFSRRTHRLGDAGSTEQQVLRLNVPRESATTLEESQGHAIQIVFRLIGEVRDDRVCGRAVFIRVIPRQFVGRLPRDLEAYRAAHTWLSADLN